MRNRDGADLRREWQRLNQVEATVVELKRIARRGRPMWCATVESHFGRRATFAALTPAAALAGCRKHLGYKVAAGRVLYAPLELEA